MIKWLRKLWARRGESTQGAYRRLWSPRSLPLVVWYQPSLPASLRAAWEASAAVFESAVGQPLFQRGVEAPTALQLSRLMPGSLVVTADCPRHSMGSYHGFTDFRHDPKTGCINAALVCLPWSSNGASQLRVAIHEAGHALGLPHAELLESIMYPDLGARQDPDRLSDMDIQQIRSLYSKTD